MPTKSLEQQLGDLEDVERRLRPLVTEARELVQDLRTATREAREVAGKLAEEAIKGEMGRLIEREMRDVVPDVAKFKGDLRSELSEMVGPIADLLDQVKAKYQAVSEHYDALAGELKRQGYESSGTRNIVIPVPNEHGERKRP